MSARTGTPVTTARGRATLGAPTAQAAAALDAHRLTAPGTASTLTTTSGTRHNHAATTQGKLA